MTLERLGQAVDESKGRADARYDAFLDERREAMLQSILESGDSNQLKMREFYHIGLWPSGWEAEKEIFDRELQMNREIGKQALARAA